MWCPQSILNRFTQSERGTIAIIFALLATIVMGVIGGAIDFSRAFNERLKMQASVDSAAIAGARAIALKMGDPTTVAQNNFSANYSAATPNVTSDGTKVHVNAARTMPTVLLQLMGIPELTIAAQAGAQPAFEIVETPSVGGGSVCILLLDTFMVDALDVGSASTTVHAPDCEVHVKSTRTNQAARFHTNGIFDVAKSCIEGDFETFGGGRGILGPTERNCQTLDDPYAGQLPVPTIGNCMPKRNLKNRTEYMTPGTYCGAWDFKGSVDTIEMAPGVYVLKNAVWSFNRTLKGNGVTIYFADSQSKLNLKGQAIIDIQAPTSGTYEGILMYEDYTIPNRTLLHINGGQDAIIKGLIYLPSRDMKWNGNSGVISDSLTMVLNSLHVTGNTTWRIAPFETFAMKAVGSGGTTEQVLTSIRLSME